MSAPDTPSLRLQVRQSTQYRFEAPVRYGLQQLRITARASPLQEVLQWSTTLDGATPSVRYIDHHGNAVDLISIEPETHALTVISEGEVLVEDQAGVVGAHRGPSPLWLYLGQTPLTAARMGVRGLLKEVSGTNALSKLHSLSEIIRNQVTYTLGASQPDWSAEDALGAGKGVCQDHTHIFLAAARALEIPARYVSGYLMLNDRTTQEAMHAWAEAYVDGLGWVGFDISNGISPDARYIRVATGRDYREAAPVIGSQIGGVGETLAVEIEVAQQ